MRFSLELIASFTIACASLIACSADEAAPPRTSSQGGAGSGATTSGGSGGSLVGGTAGTTAASGGTTGGATTNGGTASGGGGTGGAVSSVPLVPAVDGEWWQLVSTPDLGPEFNKPGQQPVDFSIWPAADGQWHLWSCIRGTACPGKDHLFYGWQGANPLAALDPVGISMQADTTKGELECGLQAPFVFEALGGYQLMYGTWNNIARATSTDGTTFERVLNNEGTSSVFADGWNPRDPMVITVGDTYYAYYTANPDNIGQVYVRTSKDLVEWSASTIVARGGMAGSGPYTTECPHVVPRPDLGVYYLFITQAYAPADAQHTIVYRSTDPMYFGVDGDDQNYVETLAVAAPEIFQYQDQWYIAALNPGLNGIRAAKLAWVEE